MEPCCSAWRSYHNWQRKRRAPERTRRVLAATAKWSDDSLLQSAPTKQTRLIDLNENAVTVFASESDRCAVIAARPWRGGHALGSRRKSIASALVRVLVTSRFIRTFVLDKSSRICYHIVTY